MDTPFLPPFRSQLGPMGRAAKDLRIRPLPQLQILFEPLIPTYLLAPADEGDHSRERLFPLRHIFFAFLWQVLNYGASCREALRQMQAQAGLLGLETGSENSAGFCAARGKIPLDILERIFRNLRDTSSRRVRSEDLWLEREVKIIDGTSFVMPDTMENQAVYPQSSTQKSGCGFPLMHLVGVFSLASGALLDFAKGSLHSQDIHFLGELRNGFKRGDIALTDRGFCSQPQFALSLNAGIDVVSRLLEGKPSTPGSKRKRRSLTRIKRLGLDDWLMSWKKPYEKPKYMSQDDWEKVPKTIIVRVLKVKVQTAGIRTRKLTIVTTLLDPERYSAKDIAGLYRQRWRIELSFRDLKTTMRMEMLRCKTPAMVEKEILMHFIAHNLMRLLIQEAAVTSNVQVQRLSFKGTVDTLRQYVTALGTKRSAKKTRQMLRELLNIIGKDLVPNRPGRREPRALKRRPKPFALLTSHRHTFKEIPHRSRYRKKPGP